VIKNFKDKEAEKIYNEIFSKKLPYDIQRQVLKKLEMLNAARRAEDLRIPPANRLEKLSGDRKGQWAIRINNQYRICFNWIDDDAYDVEIVDYH